MMVNWEELDIDLDQSPGVVEDCVIGLSAGTEGFLVWHEEQGLVQLC